MRTLPISNKPEIKHKHKQNMNTNQNSVTVIKPNYSIRHIEDVIEKENGYSELITLVGQNLDFYKQLVIDCNNHFEKEKLYQNDELQKKPVNMTEKETDIFISNLTAKIQKRFEKFLTVKNYYDFAVMKDNEGKEYILHCSFNLKPIITIIELVIDDIENGTTEALSVIAEYNEEV